MCYNNQSQHFVLTFYLTSLQNMFQPCAGYHRAGLNFSKLKIRIILQKRIYLQNSFSLLLKGPGRARFMKQKTWLKKFVTLPL